MTISSIMHPLLDKNSAQLDMLRLDLLHPTISGNKWFKLKYNIQAARAENKTCLLSFGGAYSNHLHALAYAGKEFGMKTIGIIRGERVENPTLHDCEKWGMQLCYISRSDYRLKADEHFLAAIQEKFPHAYIIPEGGKNALGVKGCTEILDGVDMENYDFITCSVGTGATFAGLIDANYPKAELLGFKAVKNGEYLHRSIEQYTSKRNWKLITNYHFGGFAKKNPELVSFMMDFRIKQGIELDFVYNAKMMFGLFNMIEQTTLFDQKKILAVHTGGLQGNRSLK